jgi:hypothetical protein
LAGSRVQNCEVRVTVSKNGNSFTVKKSHVTCIAYGRHMPEYLSRFPSQSDGGASRALAVHRTHVGDDNDLTVRRNGAVMQLGRFIFGKGDDNFSTHREGGCGKHDDAWRDGTIDRPFGERENFVCFCRYESVYTGGHSLSG